MFKSKHSLKRLWLISPVVLATLASFAAAPSALATGVGNAAISLVVGSLQSVSTTSATTIAPTLTSTAIGNVFIGYVEIDQGTGTAVKVSSLTSSNATWTNVNQDFAVSGKDFELWKGVITSVATSAPLTITYGGTGAVGTDLVSTGFQEFRSTAAASTVWTVDTTGNTNITTVAQTAVAYPSLAATGTGELYWGYANTGAAISAVTAGGTTGGTTTGYSSPPGEVVANPTASGTVAPTATTVSTAETNTIAALLVASFPPLVPTTGSYEHLNPAHFVSLVMDARSDLHTNPTNNGDPVQVWTDSATANQTFNIIPDGSGNFTIVSNVSGKCLDAVWDSHHNPWMNGDKLQLWTCRGTSNQLWHAYASSGAAVDAITSNASGKVIDDPAGGGNFTRLQLWTWNNNPQQHWANSGS